MGHDPHMTDMLAAAVVCLVAGELAVAPLLMTKNAGIAGVTQAALVGTMVHLFVSVAAVAVVILGHLPLGTSFVYWILGLYWVTLIALVVTFAKAVRSAPAT
jgi:hypothetical protein